MNVLILGAGASYATHGLPVASQALGLWEHTIRERHKLLAFALRVWVGSDWPRADLEEAWTRIDIAWKQREAKTLRLSVPDLTDSQRREVWRLALEAVEPVDPSYYRTQVEWARDQGYTTEQFLSVAAGWELRRLIQQEFAIPVQPASSTPYERLLQESQPATVISFNYDTLFEQYLDLEPRAWTYLAQPARSSISIQKPHGSVNWTHRFPLIHGLAEQIQFGSTVSPGHMGYQGDWLVQNLIIGLRDKIEHTSAERSLRILEVFRNILRACEQALATAEGVWVVGYRFAPADTSFLDVLARSLARRREPPLVQVIDRDSPGKLLPRIQYLFGVPTGVPSPHCFCGLQEWASHGFCHP